MSVEDRKVWERQQRENRIIDIAQDIFFQNGYEQATIIEIARASGYNKRSIYLYFKDKEEIFLAVVLKGLTLMLQMLDRASEEIGDVRALGRAFFEFSLAHPDYLKLIMVYEANTCIYRPGEAKQSQTGPYRVKCQEKTDAIAGVMIKVIEKGIQNNAIRTELSPAQLMLLLWGQVFGVMQIILMRQKDFKETYGISYEGLFTVFMEMTAAALKSPL